MFFRWHKYLFLCGILQIFVGLFFRDSVFLTDAGYKSTRFRTIFSLVVRFFVLTLVCHLNKPYLCHALRYFFTLNDFFYEID